MASFSQVTISLQCNIWRILIFSVSPYKLNTTNSIMSWIKILADLSLAKYWNLNSNGNILPVVYTISLLISVSAERYDPEESDDEGGVSQRVSCPKSFYFTFPQEKQKSRPTVIYSDLYVALDPIWDMLLFCSNEVQWFCILPITAITIFVGCKFVYYLLHRTMEKNPRKLKRY